MAPCMRLWSPPSTHCGVEEPGVGRASGVGFMQEGFLWLGFATPEDDIVSGRGAARS